MKKKGIVLALVAAFCMAALTGCGGGSDSGEKLYLYNWTEYIPQEVYDAFEEETGIEVIESTFSSNEEMLAKLTAGGTGQYDMVVASNYVIKAMEEQGLIQELDKTQLENLGNISDDGSGHEFRPGEPVFHSVYGRNHGHRLQYKDVRGAGRDHREI